MSEELADISFDNRRNLVETSSSGGNQQLDAITIIKASNHLTEHLLLENLLRGLIEVAVENAGATYGVFLLEEADQLKVQATLEVGTAQVEVLQGVPFAQFPGLPQSLIETLRAGGEAVLLRHASQQEGYSKDPYFELRQTRSVLALPIHHQGKLRGIIYLENQLASAAFTKEHLGILTLLASQMVKSLENAILYQNLQIAHDRLEEKVTERTASLHATLQEVEAVQAKVMESIRYANRIQASLLPRPETLQRALPESFVIWKPRDVVGGDFFQLFDLDDEIILVVADCTGHGVPGALLTMIVSSNLRQVIFDDGLRQPSDILSSLNRRVQQGLGQHQASSSSDDGLDAAVCRLQRHKGQLQFAGAALDLWQVKDNQVVCTSGDRQSLGYRKSKLDFPFTLHELPLEGSFYLCSDGILEQRTQDNGFPLGRKRMKKLLLEVQGSSLPEQGNLFWQKFADLLGDRNIQDDITILGFQLPPKP